MLTSEQPGQNMMTEVIQVLIADDHRLVRDMLRSLLSVESDIHVVGEATSGTEAITMINRFNPNVLLLDLTMPGKDGLQVLREIQVTHPSVKTVVLTGVDDQTALLDALQLGAQGYLLKDSSMIELVQAIRAVHGGEAFLHPRSTRWLVDRFRSTSGVRTMSETDMKLVNALRPREREVLTLLCAGLSNREIGERLSITDKTAKTHVANLLKRIGVRDRMQAALFALRCGLCEPGEGLLS